MPSIQVDLDESQDKTVELTKVLYDLPNKQESIKHIIDSFEPEKEK